ncbi:hypothetical protein [Deinococcus soli (ex Cha et al. 2016)]|uniref:Repeat protein (TIGR01451 family) n=2 Tax=Deinococcus soli (ex Cha et al. 2016) TaxID=1309411 RepID=A0ACC6KH65_9DEIO|nr:hypothetical protein [Deinococcus soli (ex Cha et al. 2016)]MDR6218975.1 putative repeat protein (TIGR01451 family) [Deinococcus soli (ex Cha et al. 2016)]MDR6328772.1 putative repeat protein (TIGR01451 family) [Deinococcus soli (ex Cha et al. 2016)]MDR6751741.1 putative repeat protein (TIGR01451 family) [Deinococcus soli (ex Cha et al. 2016)]
MRRAALILALLSGAASAEGSLTFAPSGTAADRPFLDTGAGNALLGGIARKTLLYAYATSGETLLLGQSAAQVGGVTRVTSPAGTTTTCAAATAKNPAGLIASRTQELNGPNVGTVTTGYVPCSYAVTSSGIYQVEFLSPDQTAIGTPPITPANGAWPAPATTDRWIAAWDVTVTSGTVKRSGRVFTRHFAMNVGGNNRRLDAELYPLTKDGYLYKVRLTLDPFGFIFYANNVGNLTASGNPLYRTSEQAAPQHLPTGADTARYVTHKLFLNPPDAALPASAPAPSGMDGWLRRATPDLPPTPTNLSFSGSDGTTGQAGSGLGGTFTFTNPGAVTYAYRLVLPFSQNGVNTDRVLVGLAQPGATTTVPWDGKDGSGKDVVSSDSAYTARAYLAAGEVHFPLIDVENSSGLNIERLTQADSLARVVYWDDRGATKAGGVLPTGTAPNPAGALMGVDSTSAAHGYSGLWGNELSVDTWAYYPSSPATFSSGIAVREADVQITKALVQGGAAGYPSVFTVTVRNASATTTAQGVRVQDPVPSGFSAFSWTCPSGCAAPSGTGALDTTVTLTPGAAVTITVTGTVAAGTASGTSLTNTATASRGRDASDPTFPNAASATFTVRAPVTAVTLNKTVRNVTQGTAASTSNAGRRGDTLEYVIRFANTGDRTLTAARVNDTLNAYLLPDTQATLVCPSGAAHSVPLNGAVLNVDVAAVCGPLKGSESGTLTVRATVR